jgi:hypothetical protein
VTAAPELWLPVTSSSEQKRAARMAQMTPYPTSYLRGEHEPRILEGRQIPAERRVIATETFSKGEHFVQKGQAYHEDDAVVQLAPEMFQRVGAV